MKELFNFMLYKVTKLKANDFDFFLKLISNLIEDKQSLAERLMFLFDLFSDFGMEMS